MRATDRREREARAALGTRARMASQRQNEGRWAHTLGFNNPLTPWRLPRAGDAGIDGDLSPPPPAAKAARVASRVGESSHHSQRSAAAEAKPAPLVAWQVPRGCSAARAPSPATAEEAAGRDEEAVGTG